MAKKASWTFTKCCLIPFLGTLNVSWCSSSTTWTFNIYFMSLSGFQQRLTNSGRDSRAISLADKNGKIRSYTVQNPKVHSYREIRTSRSTKVNFMVLSCTVERAALSKRKICLVPCLRILRANILAMSTI